MWWSWRQLAARVAVYRHQLGSLPPGAPVTFEGRVRPKHLALDLAVQAAGGVPRPSSAELPAPSEEGWVDFESWEPEPEEREAQPELEGETSLPPAGVAVVSGGAWVRLGAERLDQARRALAGELGSVPRRPIVMLSGPLARPEERVWWTWALVAGAAVVASPSSAETPSVFEWSRPSHACLRSDLAARCLEVAERQGRRRWGRRFFRLSRIRVWGDPGASPEAIEAWSRLGVSASRFSVSVGPGPPPSRTRDPVG